jgi:hypothetical protein
MPAHVNLLAKFGVFRNSDVLRSGKMPDSHPLRSIAAKLKKEGRVNGAMRYSYELKYFLSH